MLSQASIFDFGIANFTSDSSEVDTIFHIGANVNHVLPYQTLRDENVLATLHLLKFASTSQRRILFNYASSISTLSGWSKRAVASEEEIAPPNSLKSIGGYAQTKWVCENLCKEFKQKRGLDVNVIRLGMISWHGESGVSNTEDWLEKLFFGCTLLGQYVFTHIGAICYPDEFCCRRPPCGSLVDVFPVDLAVKVIWEVSARTARLASQAASSTDLRTLTVNVIAGQGMAYNSVFQHIVDLRLEEPKLIELTSKFTDGSPFSVSQVH